MSSFWRTDRPCSPRALLDALYRGQVFLLSPSAPAEEACARVEARVRAAFDADDYRTAAAERSSEDVFTRVGRVRRELFEDTALRACLFALVAAEGLDPTRVAIDAPRLRCIVPRGEQNPRARAVYAPHRDTWYGHPPSLVTWWLPLDELPAEETFVFYPSLFAAPVENDSAAFDYGRWTAAGPELRVGWQDPDAGLRERYPAALPMSEAAVGFSCRRAELLLFAGAQLHRTLPQDRGRARFSFDLRVVALDDEAAGLGAPCVDNEARGSALVDYWRWSP